jgi:hypothetical protein
MVRLSDAIALKLRRFSRRLIATSSARRSVHRALSPRQREARHWPRLPMGPFYNSAELAKASRQSPRDLERLSARHSIIPMHLVENGRPTVFYSSLMLDGKLRPIPGLFVLFTVLHLGLDFDENRVVLWLGGPLGDPATGREWDLQSRIRHLRNGYFDQVYDAAIRRVGHTVWQSKLTDADRRLWADDMAGVRRVEADSER